MAEWTDETIAAYVAAFVDADGSIGLSKNRKRTDLVQTYVLRVSLYNNNPDPLQFVQGHFGGSLHSREPGGNRFAKCTQYTLVWQARKGAALLERILPYLIAKKEQGEIALAFRKRHKQDGFNCHTDKSWMEAFAIQLRQLKAKYRGAK